MIDKYRNQTRLANIVLWQDSNSAIWNGRIDRIVMKFGKIINKYHTEQISDNDVTYVWQALKDQIGRLDFELYQVSFNEEKVDTKEEALDRGHSMFTTNQ